MTCCWWCKHDVGEAVISAPTGGYKTQNYRESTPARYETLTPSEQEKIVFVRSICTRPVCDPSTMKYETEGHFCTFECARAYIIKEKTYDYERRIQNLAHLRSKAMREKGVDIPKFISAPSWKLLDIFGGSLTYEQFRSDKEEWVVQPKNIIFDHIVPKKKHQPLSMKKSWKENEKIIADTYQPTEQMKIKRSKPRVSVPGFGDIGNKLGLKKNKIFTRSKNE